MHLVFTHAFQLLSEIKVHWRGLRKTGPKGIMTIADELNLEVATYLALVRHCYARYEGSSVPRLGACRGTPFGSNHSLVGQHELTNSCWVPRSCGNCFFWPSIVGPPSAGGKATWDEQCI